MGAANTYEAYDAIEKRLAPRLEAFVRTGHYAELSAILAKARATVAATLDGVAARVVQRRGFDAPVRCVAIVYLEGGPKRPLSRDLRPCSTLE